MFERWTIGFYNVVSGIIFFIISPELLSAEVILLIEPFDIDLIERL